ncbi:MAG: N-acetyltransferase [Muribaculaceae bacterium]|nr:N-acetyltransferase [Muribaculaceae bacterium]
MAVEIREVAPTKKEIKRFVKFGIDHYKGNQFFVPPLVMDDVNTLLPSKNPAFDFCEAQSFMAYRDGKPVGRITAIINNAVNERTGQKSLRFGFVEFIDDDEVVDALFDAAEEWGRKRGMTRIVGPMGFSDMDHEGMLVEGFDQLGTMASIYNYDYYPRQLERRGMTKEVDWIEFLMTVPDAIPDKYQRIAEIVKKKYDLHNVKITSRKHVKEQYGRAIFDLINEAYDGLYGYSPLTPRQIEYYIDMYLGILRLDDISLVVNKDDKLVAVGISIASFSRALQKSKGKIFPFGWWHLLKPLRGKVDIVDLLLVAVKPEYQGKGVNALLFTDLIPRYIKNGYKYAESNVELEGNEAVQKQWEYFERRQHKRRRSYAKEL